MAKNYLTPERSIKSSNQDQFGYSIFVEKLAKPLIRTTSKDYILRSTGLIIGLTGEWGAGKSSVLNLLEEHIVTKYQRTRPNGSTFSPIVVRFDPWLVVDKNEVINQFFLSLAEEVKTHHNMPGIYRDRYDQSVDEIVNSLADYASLLTPLLEIFAVGSSVPANILLNALKIKKKQQLPISKQKSIVEKALKSIDVPIIVLIDELDRIDDEEIKLMVQIVKSIVDFESISYVIAYDEYRVAKVLGNENVESGHAYLEKIVQIQIPIPTIFNDEIKTFFETRLCDLLGLSLIDQEFRENKNRLEEFYKHIFAYSINTTRKANLLATSYMIRSDMVRYEVSPTDILAWEVFRKEFPKLTTRLIENYSEVLFKGDHHNLLSEFILLEEKMTDSKYRLLQNIILFLFDSKISPRNKNSHGDDLKPFQRFQKSNRLSTDIKNLVPFVKLVRLGVQDKFVGRTEIIEFFKSKKKDKFKILNKYLKQEGTNRSLRHFLEQFLEHSKEEYNILSGETIKNIEVILEFINLLSKKDIAKHIIFEDMSFRIKASVPPWFPEDLHYGPVFVSDLLKQNIDHFAAEFIRFHIYHYGLFGVKKRPSENVFLTESETLEYAHNFLNKFSSVDEASMKNILCTASVDLLLDLEKWSLNEQTTAIKLLRKDTNLVDSQIISFFGGNNMITPEHLGKIYPIAEFKELIIARQRSTNFNNLRTLINWAYHKANQELQIDQV